MFRQLSFDTSNSDVHLALLEDDAAIIQRVVSVTDAASGASRQEAANLLIPGIDRMVREAGWVKSDIDCIIVGTGPGGFTGIRTSVVTARALAQALRLPLYPVSILECMSSALPGNFAIALYATIDHFFMATCEHKQVVSSYVEQTDVAKSVGNLPVVYVDERARSVISSPEDPIRFVGSPELRDIPKIENIAVQQAKFAWDRLSLKVNAIYERLNKLDAPNRNEAQPLQQKLRSELCLELPFDSVVPTYLRAPSVTLKKTNV